MKLCNACHVKVQSKKDLCPLCGTPLFPSDIDAPPINQYPDLTKSIVQYNFIYRILLFLTITSIGVSLLVNWLVFPQFMWSLIVLASAVYCWVTIPPLLRRGANFAALSVLQVLVTSVLVVALDFIVGYKGWSTAYVVPALMMAGILVIGLMVIFNRTRWYQYVLYQVTMALLGFTPLILHYTGLKTSLVMVIISTSLGLASLALTIAFGDRSIKTEFRRRFHL